MPPHGPPDRPSAASRSPPSTAPPTCPSTTRATSAIPGEPPFTRGVHPTMYRGRLWTMRQYAGFGTARADQRALPLPARAGPDRALGRVRPADADGLRLRPRRAPRRGRPGRRGDLDARRHGGAARRAAARPGLHLDDDQRHRADPAGVLRRGGRSSAACPRAKLGGHGAERHAQGVHRARHLHLSARAVAAPDHRRVRVLRARSCRSGTRSRSRGYHIREAGATAVQELAFTLADGARLRARPRVDRGLDVDAFAPRLSFFFNAHNHLFEEVAKFRAARRLWARLHARALRRAATRAALMLRFHTQTAGSTLTAQQPLVNVVRTTVQALAAVLGGTQSLHTNSLRRGARPAHRRGGAAGAAHPAGARLRERRRRHRRSARAARTSSRR